MSLIIDSFAGGGGASHGIEMALGRSPDIAINHDRLAVQMHQQNHRDTKHFCENIWKVHPVEATQGQPVDLAWFSPDCTHFSKARGGKPVEKNIRGLAWIVIKWAKLTRPRVIIVENVEEFKTWGPIDKDGRIIKERKGETFDRWVNQLKILGYDVQWKELVAADYGTPTTRKRLFIVARYDGQEITWPEPTHGPAGDMFGLKSYRTAAECIDWSLPCPSIFTRKKPLVANTMKRIARGLRKFVFETNEPFIVTCNHGGDHFRGQGLTEPMKTVTAARDAQGLVVPYVAAIDNKSQKSGSVYSGGDPLRTIVQENRFALVGAFLTKYHGLKGGEVRGCGMAEQIQTVDTQNRFGLVTSCMRETTPTVTATGQHLGEVRAFLMKYYKSNVGQSPAGPLQTVTSKHRFGLVMIAGVGYQIVDIGMRMLTPRELARAQGFPDSYILTGTKTSQVARIGNSVCPPVAEALVRANVKPLENESVVAG